MVMRGADATNFGRCSFLVCSKLGNKSGEDINLTLQLLISFGYICIVNPFNNKSIILSQYSYKLSLDFCLMLEISFLMAVVLEVGKNFSRNILFKLS